MTELLDDERSAAAAGLEYIISRLNNIDGDHLRDFREKRLDASRRALAKIQPDTNVSRKPSVEASKPTKGKDSG